MPDQSPSSDPPVNSEVAIEQLRRLLGIKDDQPKVAGAIDFTDGKTPNERYQEEMKRLHEGGSDPGGKDQLRKMMGRMFRRR